MNDRELLKKYAPELRFANIKGDEFPDPERYFPSSVDAFVENASSVTELRLWGRYSIRPQPIPHPGRADRLDEPPPYPSFWRRLLISTPLLQSGVSLRYIDDDDLKDARNAGCGKEGIKEKEEETKTRLQGAGCGCLVLLLPLAGLIVLLVRLWGWEIAAPVGLGLVTFGMSIFLPTQGLQMLVASAGFTPFIWLVANLLSQRPNTPWICSGLWVVFAFILFLTQTLSTIDDWLRRLVERLSGLDECTARAAIEKTSLLPQQEPVYYGRVIRPPLPSRWQTILQYWFFYPMNDWRTIHFGLDDHEGDWETIHVFLPFDPSQRPMVAYSAHIGVTIRPLSGPRPVAYVGGGSHANYPEPGEYSLLRLIINHLPRNPFTALPALISALDTETPKRAVRTEVQLRQQAIKRRKQFSETIQRLPQNFSQSVLKTEPTETASESPPDTSEQLSGEIVTREFFNRLDKLVPESLKPARPIIDRALGDGKKINNDMENNDKWGEPVLINDTTPWVRYRGRWGVSVLWPGESGPGGPKYDQDGNVRLAWSDPVAWAKLPR
jgi:hypothetical protein